MHFFSITLKLVAFANMILSSAGAPTETEDQVSHIADGSEKPANIVLQGSLVMPTEGAQFVNQGGAMGDIQLVYKCPNAVTTTQAGDRTVAIDVVLVPRREEGYRPGPSEVVLARGLRTRIGEGGERIQTNFVPPVSVCGDYRMVVTEKQIFNNVVVQLAAGAPAVSIACRTMDEY